MHLRTFGLLLVAIGGLGVPAARAQEAAAPPPPVETPRCGGLLCDLGLFGGAGSARSDLPCNDFLCRAMGGSRQAEAAPPPPVVAPEPAPAPEKKKSAAKAHKKHVAKKEPAPASTETK